MKINPAGIDLVKKFEGLSLSPYKCPAGVWTIGYGSTYYEDGTKVKMTDKAITETRASELLKGLLSEYEKAVDSYTTDALTSNQFSALVCFTYNVGKQAFKNSTLLKVVNTNPKSLEIGAQFARWNKANGKVLDGLVRRRKEEYQLYCK